MSRVKRSLIPLCIALAAIFPINMQGMKLSQFKYTSASVLPTYTHRTVKYVILARNAFGIHRGLYDDFCGNKNAHETHPVVTAAREWDDEGLVHEITGLSEQKIRDFIDIETSDNTQWIIAYSQPKDSNTVTFITDVNQYKTKLLDNFYDARSELNQLKNKEKDRIAIVKWTALKDAIVHYKDTTDHLKLHVFVLNPETNEFEKTLVPLRPLLVEKLRPYFLGNSYQQGVDKRIRFYKKGLS